MISVGFLLLSFNKFRASGILSFSIHHFYENIISLSEHNFASEHLRRNKQKINAGRKRIEEKEIMLLESMQVGMFLHCICKYFIIWDV